MDIKNIALHPKTFHNAFLKHMKSLTLKSASKTELATNQFSVTF